MRCRGIGLTKIGDGKGARPLPGKKICLPCAGATAAKGGSSIAGLCTDISCSQAELPPGPNSSCHGILHSIASMVTGIEVTGIALAVFPLVVNGLSHFAEGVATIKSWRRYRRELANYARMLEGQHISYLNTIEKLLDDIVQSDDELASLVKQPGGEVWKRPEYDVKLKKRLDHSYNPYMAIMSSMVEALESIQEVLGVSSSGEVSC